MNRAGVARGVLLAALCAVLTALGHLAGGGRLPELTVLLVLLPVLAGAGAALAERTHSAVGVVGVLGAGQLALHELMSAPAHPAHHMVAAGATPAAPGPAMIAGHAVATLLTAAALRYADRAVALLGAAVRRAVPRRPSPPAADRPLATLATPGPAVALRLARALTAAQARRGPPVGC